VTLLIFERVNMKLEGRRERRGRKRKKAMHTYLTTRKRIL
jgi:hypothetical protein